MPSQSPGKDQLLVRIQELEERLDRMQERQDVIDCLHRYPRGLDRHDSEVLASVFHEDADIRYGPDVFLRNVDEFVTWANAFHEDSYVRHVHLIEVNDVDIQGDVAHTETYVWFSLLREDRARLDVGAGRYIDRLERRNGQWKIAAREMLLEWKGTVDAAPEVPDHPGGRWDRLDPSYLRPLRIETSGSGVRAET
jgi:hypothetical protein